MGRKIIDGVRTVVPTPRDRVITNEEAAVLQAILDRVADIVAFEIYYGDGSIVSGTSLANWQQAPNTDVQVVIVSFSDTGYAVVAGMETYGFGGFAKIGTWMDDTAFFDLLDNLGNRSSLT